MFGRIFTSVVVATLLFVTALPAKADVNAPGPSAALFAHPYYSCKTNYYVATNGSDANNGTSPNSPWPLPLNVEVTFTAPDTSEPETLIPVFPVSASLRVGSVGAALAPVTPTSPTTQAATTLATTASDPNRFTSTPFFDMRQIGMPSLQSSSARPPVPRRCASAPPEPRGAGARNPIA